MTETVMIGDQKAQEEEEEEEEALLWHDILH